MLNLQEQGEFELLPELYQRWVEQMLPAGIPREREATCHQCAMCAPRDVALDSDIGFYRVSVKCCTYFPDLPNYLAGRAVAHENPGAAALREFIEGDGPGRGHATMRIVHPDAKYSTIYAQHHRAGFGRDLDLLCPYAIEKDAPTGPLCGIWKQRNAVCSTWFCKHGKGRTGVQFWHALQALLTSLEWSLSWWAITQVVEKPAAVIALGEPQVNDRARADLRPDAWSQWPGSRISFYERCADAVESLSIDDAITIAGMNTELLRIELETRFAALNATDLPKRLRAAPFNILKQNRQRATLQALSCTEPFDAPAMLISLIGYFDGRPTEETLECIRQETRVRLDAKLVRRLYDFGILEEWAAPASA